MKNIILTLLFLGKLSISSGQLQNPYLKENAIHVDFTDTTFNKELINTLKKYPLILMGELHGTQEPARFVSYLVKNFITSGTKINLGLEIPADMIKSFIDGKSIHELQQSDFFSKGYADGRASEDWFNLIEKYYNHPMVNVFYFDQLDNDKTPNRDSIMYVHVKDAIKEKPGRVTILLSGNIHNRLIAFKYGNTMGCYLADDKDLAYKGRICSINHRYKSGTMKNSSGGGLHFQILDPIESVYSESTAFKNYFCILSPTSEPTPYTAVFYSEKVTASEIMNDHEKK